MEGRLATMHYEEMAQIIERATGDIAGLELAQALRDGQGYVAIILNPDGLKSAPAVVEGSSQQTIHAKSMLRGLVHKMTFNSGRA